MINIYYISCQGIKTALKTSRAYLSKCYTGDLMPGARQKGFALFLLVIVIFIVMIGMLIFLSRDYFRSKIPVLFPNAGDVPVTPYVSASSTKLYINGEPYQFTGANAFNLASYTGNAGCGGPVNDLDSFFSKLRYNSAVRMWAFQGMATNTTTKLTDWSGLDRVVDAAKRNNVKLILVLSDQAGTCDDGHWKDRSWYSGGYKQAFNDNNNGLTPLPYLDYVKLIAARYKDSTAVAMWEPVNEAASADCQSGKGTACYSNLTCDEGAAAPALRSFFDTVGGEIKNIDKNHLISSGVIGGGQCGAVFEDYKSLHESPGIDVASYHDYNQVDQAMPGDIWNGLQKRLDQMKQVNKPLIIGEVGMQAKDNTAGCISYATRRDKFKVKMDAQFKAGIAGYIPWNLSGGISAICNYDIVDNDPTQNLLHDYPVFMGTIPDTQAPAPPANLKATSPTQVTLTWEPATDNVGVVRYDIFRNDAYFNTTTGTSFTYDNPTPGTVYTYFVKGKDAAGNNSAESNKITVTAATQAPNPDTQSPTPPANLTARVVSSTQLILTWDASTDNVGVARYDVFRNDTYLSATTGKSVTITDSLPGTTYTFFVKGKDAAGNNSGSSNKVTITTPAS